ncbi:MAG TPA: DUF3800 domain-containing protein [Pseudolabrys sp.]|uniref:DUF3800 domain-containing protein n=1 Tax=Pseudolabrys sp. TaxID=1960880 RepID=UPI002DDD0A8B|nr:DUF3800 domain-containing protein [Pseudolabrys sp.]HEV2629519.1 DUF3800 domain-containing protein [Pseudolabrys sp.]
MGQSKIPLYAYVDETGNTGNNVFDLNQPDFVTAALITRGDFDHAHASATTEIARKVGFADLHGGELGLGRIDAVADDLLALLKRVRADFFFARVEKKYLLATKVFDSLSDSGENAAVGWHHYNLRLFRIMLAFKLSAAIDDETGRLFWECILEPNETKAYEMLPRICARLHGNLLNIPDARSREILGGGLEWARVNPESIQIHTDRKIARQGHLPNFVAFLNLLHGLEGYSKERGKKVARISHDRQSEFEPVLKLWHELLSNASPEEINWAGETHIVQRVSGSEFEVKEDQSSPGIQIVDVVLWLYSQVRKGREIPKKCMYIVEYAISNGWENDFSFAGVERQYLSKFGDVITTPLNPQQEAAARALMAEMEAGRHESIERYKRDRMPPFMRSATRVIEASSDEQKTE